MEISTHVPDIFFQNPDVTEVARQLLGKLLVTEIEGVRTSGIIVETEAYCGLTDRACHAFPLKRTRRTEPMFLPGGHAYVYLCYGLHYLFNVVTGPENEPDAVLIRAVEPVDGISAMMQRRGLDQLSTKISKGPACLARALGISGIQNAKPLTKANGVWIEESPMDFTQGCPKAEWIGSTTRVGVDYAGPDAQKPWRYFIKKNKWVSALPRHLLSDG